MKRTCVATCVVVICLLAGSGCNGTTGKTVESNAEVKQLKASLEETQRRKGELEKDVERLGKSLNEAESKLATTTDAKGGLEKQVRDLTVSRTSLEARVDELGKARTGLETRVDQLTVARGQLQQRVDELAKSRDDLQKMVESLLDTRGVLEKQVTALTKAKNAALEDARSAQTKVDLLSDRLKAQTQQMIELQDQMKTIRSVLQQLQQKLE
ncbi:MAG: hypothetical protein A2Y76_03330 [Planctomycetes bacterium RBG_13_60_9]|nr:MAG: hypothetical protein A2Y76_03330 [Planctomycetes bacterium RBG_13_60_9]